MATYKMTTPRYMQALISRARSICLYCSDAFRTNSISGGVSYTRCISFGSWATKETWKKCNFVHKATEPSYNIDIERGLLFQWLILWQSITFLFYRTHVLIIIKDHGQNRGECFKILYSLVKRKDQRLSQSVKDVKNL